MDDFEKLYETCYMQVYSYVMTLCKDSLTAEEITQNAFFKAMNAGKNSQFLKSSSEVTWLCAIAKNIYIDEKRKQKRFTELPPEIDGGTDFETAVVDKDLSYRIHVILHSLEEPYKEVFQLRIFGELSFAKIGELFGKTETWARVTYHRARLKIQEKLKENG